MKDEKNMILYLHFGQKLQIPVLDTIFSSSGIATDRMTFVSTVVITGEI